MPPRLSFPYALATLINLFIFPLGVNSKAQSTGCPIVSKNYAEFLRLPKEEKKPVKDCFSDLECARIERAVGAVPYADWILCMIYTGFRISEFL